jgi:hypothetical protein
MTNQDNTSTGGGNGEQIQDIEEPVTDTVNDHQDDDYETNAFVTVTEIVWLCCNVYSVNYEMVYHILMNNLALPNSFHVLDNKNVIDVKHLLPLPLKRVSELYSFHPDALEMANSKMTMKAIYQKTCKRLPIIWQQVALLRCAPIAPDICFADDLWKSVPEHYKQRQAPYTNIDVEILVCPSLIDISLLDCSICYNRRITMFSHEEDAMICKSCANDIFHSCPHCRLAWPAYRPCLFVNNHIIPKCIVLCKKCKTFQGTYPEFDKHWMKCKI